jgi:hypothetical protein
VAQLLNGVTGPELRRAFGYLCNVDQSLVRGGAPSVAGR